MLGAGQRRKAKLSLEAKRAVYDDTVLEAGFGHSQISAAPKVLGDVVEALAAAVFLDSGRDLELTWGVCAPALFTAREMCQSDSKLTRVLCSYENLAEMANGVLMVSAAAYAMQVAASFPCLPQELSSICA